MIARILSLCVPLALIACAAATSPVATDKPNPFEDFEPVDAATLVPGPEPDASKDYDAEAVAQGRYLVNLLGCGACHTDGALIGEPNGERLLAGSSVGIAHSNPLQVKYPGVVFAVNLTPDMDTGVGAMTDEELARAIRGGVNRHGTQSLKVMPIGAYAQISVNDVNDIVAYLRSLKPVRHEVPRAVPEGTATSELFVHFGVYRNRLD